MVAATPGGGNQTYGRIPTLTIKPALYASALIAYAAANLLAAIETVVPGGAAQVGTVAAVTAVAGVFSALLVRANRMNKQIVEQWGEMLHTEQAAHRETRERLARVERELSKLSRPGHRPT